MPEECHHLSAPHDSESLTPVETEEKAFTCREARGMKALLDILFTQPGGKLQAIFTSGWTDKWLRPLCFYGHNILPNLYS